MAVEYIDSPTGYIGLGETVGLGTITPQRRKRVRKGDKGIFPMAPTGAESYEGGYRTQPYPYDTFGSGFIDPARASAAGFQQPYSSIPNVFERYAGLPGGARANPDFPFLDTVFPNIPPPDDVIEDNDDLDEELRRQTLDFDIDDDPSGRTEKDSPWYDPVAVAQDHIGELFTVPSGGSTFTDPKTGEEVTLFSDGFTAKDVGTYAGIRGVDARTLAHAYSRTAEGYAYAKSDLPKGSAIASEGDLAKWSRGMLSNLGKSINQSLGLPVRSEDEVNKISAAIFGAGEKTRQIEQYRGRGEGETTPTTPFPSLLSFGLSPQTGSTTGLPLSAAGTGTRAGTGAVPSFGSSLKVGEMFGPGGLGARSQGFTPSIASISSPGSRFEQGYNIGRAGASSLFTGQDIFSGEAQFASDVPAPSAGPFTGQDVFGAAQFASDPEPQPVPASVINIEGLVPAAGGSGFATSASLAEAEQDAGRYGISIDQFSKDGGQISFMGMKK